jgi:hypothetical protein
MQETSATIVAPVRFKRFGREIKTRRVLELLFKVQMDGLVASRLQGRDGGKDFSRRPVPLVKGEASMLVLLRGDGFGHFVTPYFVSSHRNSTTRTKSQKSTIGKRLVKNRSLNAFFIFIKYMQFPNRTLLRLT